MGFKTMEEEWIRMNALLKKALCAKDENTIGDVVGVRIKSHGHYNIELCELWTEF